MEPRTEPQPVRHLPLPRGRPVRRRDRAVRLAAAAGYRVLFTSGREADFRDVTATWLEANIVVPGMEWDLFMRPTGDRRNDAVVKLELFDTHIRDRYDVRFVYDDRDRVVAAWRSIGLAVMQVAPGAF